MDSNHPTVETSHEQQATGGTCGGPATGPSEPMGVPVPDEHLGAFVAEVFEDPENHATWDGVVSALVADESLDAWTALAPSDQIVEVLTAARRFDERAIELLSGIPLGGDGAEHRDQYDEARRYRRNADMLRTGIADAYGTGHVGDDGLLAAIDEFGFDTDRIEEREDRLEAVANAHGFDFRPYGGTLLHDDQDDDRGRQSEAW